MQSPVAALLVAVLCAGASAAPQQLRQPKVSLAGLHAAPAPAVAPASPAPAAPAVEVTKLTMTMNDVNYAALTKTETGVHGQESTYSEVRDAACDAVKAAVQAQVADGPAAAPGPAGSASPAPAVAASPVAALLQGAAPGPAAVPADGPAGGPASVITLMPPPAPKVDVNCALHPNADGTTNFVAQITDPNTKHHLLNLDPSFNSTLEHAICAKIHHETGIHAGCSEVLVSIVQVQEWSHGICEPHLHTMVSRFSNAYTRAQVPVAIYNACSLFMTALSFSHDHIINDADTKRCQIATLKFKKTWKYGSLHDTTKVLDDICHDICEQKFGNHAPQCHVTRGDAHGGLAPAR